MKNTDLSESNTIPNEVKINLNMLGTVVLNWIR
jgi:hypothetical protein